MVFGFFAKPKQIHKLLLGITISNIVKNSGQLHSQESREYNWMFNIGEILKIDMVLAVTTQTIKSDDKT